MKTNQKIILTAVALLTTTCFNAQAADKGFTLRKVETIPSDASPSRFAGLGLSGEVRRQVEEQVTEIARLKVRVQDLEESYAELRINKESVEDHIERLRDQLHEMSEEHQVADKEILELTDAKLVQERVHAELRRVNDDLLFQLSDVKLQLEQAGQKLAEQKALVLAEKKKAAEASEEVLYVNGLNGSLDKELQAQKALVSAGQQLEGVLQQQVDAIGSLRKQLEEAQALLQRQNKQIVSFECQIRDQQDLLNKSSVAASADASFVGGNLLDDLDGHPDVDVQQGRAARAEGMLEVLHKQIAQLLGQSTVGISEEDSLQLDQKITKLSEAKAAKEAELLRLQPGAHSSLSRASYLRLSSRAINLDFVGSELLLAGAAVGSMKFFYDKRQTRQQVEALQQEVAQFDLELKKLEQQKRMHEENKRLRAGLQGLISCE